MTLIENDSPKVQYTGPFSKGQLLPLTFPYIATEDVKMIIDDEPAIFNVDYEIIIEPNDEHPVAYPNSAYIKNDLPNAKQITLYRVTPLDQQAPFPQQSKFRSERIEQALDKLTMQQQEQEEQLSRCIIAPITLETFNGQLPEPAADQALKWNSEGTELENYDIIGAQEAFEQQIKDDFALFEDEIDNKFVDYKNTVDSSIQGFKDDVNQTIDENQAELLEIANSSASIASQAMSVAQSTIDTANTARQIAEAAEVKSDSAVTVAGSANTNATNAVNTAEGAVTIATNASAKSDNAVATANTAQGQAEQAVTTANTAVETANNTQHRVDVFEEDINTVLDAADKIFELDESVQTAVDAATLANAAAESATQAAGDAVQAVEEALEATQRVETSLADKADKTEIKNGTLTIQNNGATIATFSANQDSNVTANLLIPDTAAWGNITGTLSSQTDLQNALNTKANDSNVVHKTGNETVDGDKTFSNKISADNGKFGKALKATIYNTALTPSSQYYWYKIYTPSAGRFTTFDIYVHGDQNYAFFSRYTLSISAHETTTVSVVLLNHGGYGTSNLKVAFDRNGNVYISTNCLWDANFQINMSAGTYIPTYEQMGYAPWGTPAGFESAGMITDSGAMRLTRSNGSVQLYTPEVKTVSAQSKADGEGRNIVSTYQGKLTAGNNIKIEDDVISSTSAGLQMFDTILKDHILTYEESKGLALQGTYVYKDAIAGSRYGYPDFYNKVVEEYNEASQEETVNGVTVKVHSNGHKFYNIADKSDIDEYFSVIGTAWFYGVDTENERVFLPRNNWFEQATGDIAEVGLSIEAGLPNIEANLYRALFYPGGTYGADGAFSFFGDLGKNAGAGSSQKSTDVNFDASKSNPIYGNSDTVQPNAVKKLLYICVGNTTNYEGVTNVINQGMEILEQVNQGIETRVKLDGSNAQFPYITETFSEGTSWYRVYSDGWCEQGGYIASASGDYTLSFLKPFINTNYVIFKTMNSNSTNNASYSNNSFFSRTLSSAKTATASVGFSWQACGYIA